MVWNVFKSLLLDICTKKNYQCYSLSCFSCYCSFHYFFYCYCYSCLRHWRINVMLSLSLQMVSANSKRGLIKALYNATRASKGNRCLNLTSQSFDSLLQPWFDILIPSQNLMNDNTEILDWIFTLKVLVINDRLDTLAGLQPPTTTKQYELRIPCGHLTTFPNQWKSANLKWPVQKWIRLERIRPWRMWTSLYFTEMREKLR